MDMCSETVGGMTELIHPTMLPQITIRVDKLSFKIHEEFPLNWEDGCQGVTQKNMESTHTRRLLAFTYRKNGWSQDVVGLMTARSIASGDHRIAQVQFIENCGGVPCI